MEKNRNTYEAEEPRNPNAAVAHMADRAVAFTEADIDAPLITEWPVGSVTKGDGNIFYDKDSGRALTAAPDLHQDNTL